MPTGLKNITQAINDEIWPHLEARGTFAGSQLFTLATPSVRNDTPQVVAPFAFTPDGRGIYVGVDDIHPFILYHRVQGITFTTGGRGYGDLTAHPKLIYQMSLLLYHDRERTAMEADELVLLLHAVFPSSIAMLPFDSITLSLRDVILNSRQVFGSEYSGIDFFLKPEHALTQINYTIESTFKKNCFNPATYY